MSSLRLTKLPASPNLLNTLKIMDIKSYTNFFASIGESLMLFLFNSTIW